MTNPDLTYEQLLDAAEAYEDEKSRWVLRVNKAAMDFNIEVCRKDDTGIPVMVIGTRHMATAERERHEQALAAGMRAAVLRLPCFEAR